MANFKLGVSPEELKKELAEKQKALEEEILLKSQQQEAKLQEIIKRNKKKKIIVVSSLVVASLALLTFGTVNTFFKDIPTEQSIREVIGKNVKQFPVSGLDGFIRNNFNTWLKSTLSFEDKNIEYVRSNLSTLSVDNVIQQSSFLARVYFSMDIETKLKDIENPDKTTTPGKRTVTRYQFYIPVEYFSQRNSAGEVTALGYRPNAPLSMYLLDRIDTAEITENENMKFNSERQPQNVETDAKTKVDRVLADMFGGKDVSKDFLSYLKFNNRGLTYKGIFSFEFYQKANNLGFNAKVTYNTTTKEGFNYRITSYLALSKNGNSWIITGMQ